MKRDEHTEQNEIDDDAQNEIEMFMHRMR